MAGQDSQVERAEWRRERLLALLNEAAEEGQGCPPNAALAKYLGFRTASSARWCMTQLERRGDISIEGRGDDKIITICATGKSTVHASEIAIQGLIGRAASVWSVRTGDIYGPSHRRCFVLPRAAVYLVALEQGWRSAQVGRVLARDHSTILHGRARALEWGKRNAFFAHNLRMLRETPASPARRSA